MKIVYNTVLYVALASFASAVTPGPDARDESGVHATQEIGGNYGTWFDDFPLATNSHKRIASIRLVGCGEKDHVIAMELGYRDNKATHPVITYSFHGGRDKLKDQRLDLKTDEYVVKLTTTTFEARVSARLWYKKEYHTRIGSLQFETNHGNKLKCGASLPKDPVVVSSGYPPDVALLHFNGRSGEALDFITANWIPKADF